MSSPIALALASWGRQVVLHTSKDYAEKTSSWPIGRRTTIEACRESSFRWLRWVKRITADLEEDAADC